MNQNKRFQDPDVEAWGKIALFFLAAVLAIFILPIILTAFLFSYLAWASFNEKEERKWLRASLLVVTGYLVTHGLWISSKEYIPSILSGIFTQRKITNIMGSELIQKAEWSYFLILIGGFYLFECNFV